MSTRGFRVGTTLTPVALPVCAEVAAAAGDGPGASVGPLHGFLPSWVGSCQLLRGRPRDRILPGILTMRFGISVPHTFFGAYFGSKKRSHQMYYMFDFLFLVIIILLITCSEATVLLCYFHVCAEEQLDFSPASGLLLKSTMW
ncbi:putative phagocytic receptor 1a [Microcebus murinus]|uniref:putative phagocytic receptor 1a n=1 Tax=Microcebus murinus TaxID=30608 RepID=UPI003F6B63F2